MKKYKIEPRTYFKGPDGQIRWFVLKRKWLFFWRPVVNTWFTSEGEARDYINTQEFLDLPKPLLRCHQK